MLWDSIIVRVGGCSELVERIVEMVIAGGESVEKTRAAIVAPCDGRLCATRGQVRRVENGGVGVVLVHVHFGHACTGTSTMVADGRPSTSGLAMAG